MRICTVIGLLGGAAALFALGWATSGQEVTKAGDFQEGGIGRPIATKPAPGLDTVYFDYDRAEIRNDARGKLQGNASVIEDKKWERVVLEGHCDERGAEEYNLALGERRAVAAKQYLMMCRVFDELGYRRYEWKCDHLNAPSLSAARRLGFRYEGTFRQAVVTKGRNRDTAWFSITDKEWPAVRSALEAWLDSSNFDEDGLQRRSLEEIRNS